MRLALKSIDFGSHQGKSAQAKDLHIGLHVGLHKG